MFGKNLKYYRLKNNMSMKELAEVVNISPMAISHYEKEERRPDMKTIKALANALHVRVTDFLASRDETLIFCHGEFRKNFRMAAKQQELVKEEVEEYFGRFFQAVNILGGDVLSDYPVLHSIELSSSAEENASKMRKKMELSPNGPISGLVEILENKGILVYLCDINDDNFSCMNGTVNERPYIIINKNMNSQRIRSTIVHELAHLLFIWPKEMPDKEIEKMANAISGAFLFPLLDMKRELGIRRSAITNDMVGVCKEYGISMYMLVMRANKSGIVNDYTARNFYIKANKAGWKKNEPSRANEEKNGLFEQLVYRAVTENEITPQRGAELLHESIAKVMTECSAMEV